jgi:hypothetical protein
LPGCCIPRKRSARTRDDSVEWLSAADRPRNSLHKLTLTWTGGQLPNELLNEQYLRLDQHLPQLPAGGEKVAFHFYGLESISCLGHLDSQVQSTLKSQQGGSHLEGRKLLAACMIQEQLDLNESIVIHSLLEKDLDDQQPSLHHFLLYEPVLLAKIHQCLGLSMAHLEGTPLEPYPDKEQPDPDDLERRQCLLLSLP